MTKTLEDIVEKNDSNELSEVERKQEERYKAYQRTYVGWLSEEEERTQSQTTQATVTVPKDKNIYEFNI